MNSRGTPRGEQRITTYREELTERIGRISRAIGHLREHFDEPLKIDDIAHQLGMTVSGFHHHFKSVTAVSPLQFQSKYDYRKHAV